MSLEFLNKVKYLCSNIPEVEWSGALFFSVEGSIKEPKTFKIILQDILPLDKGTKAWTEYELDGRYDDYIMDENHPERLDWTLGHIHSHNSMRVFFSGADKDELNDNVANHNYYVSLIVNNYMEFVAKVAFTAKLDKKFNKVPYVSLDEDGKSYNSLVTDLTYNTTKMFTYDCEIIAPERERITVNEQFSSAVSEIMKPKPAPITEVKKLPANTWERPTYQMKPHQINIVNKMKAKPDTTKVSDRAKEVNKLIEKIPFTTYEDLAKTDLPDLNEMFIAEVMKFSTPLEIGEDLEDVLGVLEDMKLDSYQIAESALRYYPVLYDKYFPDALDEDFISDAEISCDLLFDFIQQFPFVNVTIEAIKEMVKKFEKNATTV